MNNTEATIKRAGILLEQSRYEQAEKELRSALAYEPQHILAIRMLISCQLGQHKNQEALELSQSLIGLQPEDPYNLYIHSVVLLNLERDQEAEPFIREAIGQEPYEADFYDVLARVYFLRKEWETALEYANEGLSIDPSHLGCLNIRTVSLTKLNRKAEAHRTIEDVLQQDPENAYSHANVGWAKLEDGDYEAAQLHFAEALRLEPSLEHARAGMLEALKAKNFFYRGFLQFFFWLGKFKGNTQWAILIGFWLGKNLLQGLAKTYPFLVPVVYLMAFLFYLTWIIEPLFNLFIKLDKYGKHLLNEREQEGANWVGALLGLALVSGLAGWLADIPDFFLLAVFGATMVIPVARLYSVRTEREKRVIRPYTLALAGVGLLGLALAALGIEMASIFLVLYLLGIFLFGWVANGLAIR